MRKIMLLALCLCLLLCGGAAAGTEDPAAVRVGAFSYPLSLVQGSLDSAIRLNEAVGNGPMSAEERAKLAGDIIENMVGIGLIEAKLTEAGQHDFTAEEQEMIDAAARSRYEELWQSVHRMMQEKDPEVTGEQVVAAMEEEGYTLDALRLEYEVSERQRRAVALFVRPVLLTEQMLEDYYETQFLAPDRERYSHDIPRYEREVLATGSESFYTPAGYRYFRQIQLSYPDEVTEALKPQAKAVEKAARETAEAMAAVAQLAITADDWSELDEPRAAYDAAAAALEKANRAYADARREITLPLIRDTLDAIQERLAAGIDFRMLISEYSTDTGAQNTTGAGYPLHPESEGWPADFIAAGMALEKPGDVSEPVLTDKGIHILYYDSDAPAGDHALTEEEKELLKESAEYYYQVQALQELMETWKEEYEIETHPEMLETDG